MIRQYLWCPQAENHGLKTLLGGLFQSIKHINEIHWHRLNCKFYLFYLTMSRNIQIQLQISYLLTHKLKMLFTQRTFKATFWTENSQKDLIKNQINKESNPLGFGINKILSNSSLVTSRRSSEHTLVDKSVPSWAFVLGKGKKSH